MLHRELDVIRREYLAAGRGEEFDRCVALLRAENRWPFDAHPVMLPPRPDVDDLDVAGQAPPEGEERFPRVNQGTTRA